MKAFYDKNGYFVYPKLVDMSKCNQMLESIRKHANKDYAAIMNPDRIDFLAQQSPIKNEGILQETAILMRNIMKDQSIVEVLECFQGERVVGLMSQMLFKEVGSPYANQAWNPHQDNAYPQNRNNKYLTTNLFLEDANLINGIMFFILNPIVSHYCHLTQPKVIGKILEIIQGRLSTFPLNIKKLMFVSKKEMSCFYTEIRFMVPILMFLKNIRDPFILVPILSRGEEFISGNTAKREIIYLN